MEGPNPRGVHSPGPDPARGQRAEPASERRAKPATEQTSEPASERRAKPATEQTSEPATERRTKPALDGLLERVGGGDQRAFEGVFDSMAGPVYGLIYQVLRDPAQSEEVSQEVMLEVWRTAARFDPARGSAASWVMTIAHRRAIDRVRSVSAAAAREHRAAARIALEDQVGDSVEARLARERVRRCLEGLTELQRESITLAYYGGYSYRQVAGMLGVALSTVKTRIRAGLIRMRDCLGVQW